MPPPTSHRLVNLDVTRIYLGEKDGLYPERKLTPCVVVSETDEPYGLVIRFGDGVRGIAREGLLR